MLAITHQASACEQQPFSCMIWQMTYNHELLKLCSATLIGGCLVEVKPYVDLKDAAYPSKSIMTIRLAF